MPSASVLRREWRRPPKTYANGFDRIGVGAGFRPGLTFDLYDPAGNRLGWGRVTGLGDIELFDAASNRLGSVRPTYRAFSNGNGMSPDLKKMIEAILLKHPDWDREQIKIELRRLLNEGGDLMTDTDEIGKGGS